MDVIAFALAVIGYAGLTVTAIRAAYGSLPMALWRATVLVIVVHTFLIWHVRYEWSFATATRNGYAGFLIFHGALLAIVWSAVASEPLQSRLVWVSFVVVTLGAVGAVFRYDEVAVYRLPVLALGAVGVAALLAAARRRSTGRVR